MGDVVGLADSAARGSPGNGIQTFGGVRPIGLFAPTCRSRGRARCRFAEEREASWTRPHFARGRFQNSSDVAWRQAPWSEGSAYCKESSASVLRDMYKLYELIDWGLPQARWIFSAGLASMCRRLPARPLCHDEWQLLQTMDGYQRSHCWAAHCYHFRRDLLVLDKDRLIIPRSVT